MRSTKCCWLLEKKRAVPQLLSRSDFSRTVPGPFFIFLMVISCYIALMLFIAMSDHISSVTPRIDAIEPGIVLRGDVSALVLGVIAILQSSAAL